MAKRGQITLAVGLTGVLLAPSVLDYATDVEHPKHAPPSASVNIVASTSTVSLVSAPAEWTTFRAQLVQPVEILHDGVREYIPVAPVTFVLA